METFKKVIKEVTDVAETVEKALEDKHISIIESVNIGLETFDVVKLIKKFPVAIQEFKDATPEQKKEAGEYLKEELDLINDNAEMIAENAGAMLIEAFGMFSKNKLESETDTD